MRCALARLGETVGEHQVVVFVNLGPLSVFYAT